MNLTEKQQEVLSALTDLADAHWTEFQQIYESKTGEELDEADFIDVAELAR